jgi:hypothetical protein
VFLCALFAIPGVAVGVLAAFLLAAFDTRFNVFGVALGDPCLAAACTKDCNRLCVVALLGLVEAIERALKLWPPLLSQFRCRFLIQTEAGGWRAY